MQFYTDESRAYERRLEPAFHTVGNRNTQKIERKYITLHTRIKRLARKTICFSKSIRMHNVVIGLFINHYEFGLNIWEAVWKGIDCSIEHSEISPSFR